MNRVIEARFERIEKNLEITAAINAETARLARQNEQAIKRLIALVEALVKGTGANGKRK